MQLPSLASLLLIATGGMLSPWPDAGKSCIDDGSEVVGEEGCTLIGSSWVSVMGGTSASEFWRVVGDIGTESEAKNNMYIRVCMVRDHHSHS